MRRKDNQVRRHIETEIEIKDTLDKSFAVRVYPTHFNKFSFRGPTKLLLHKRHIVRIGK